MARRAAPEDKGVDVVRSRLAAMVSAPVSEEPKRPVSENPEPKIEEPIQSAPVSALKRLKRIASIKTIITIFMDIKVCFPSSVRRNSDRIRALRAFY